MLSRITTVTFKGIEAIPIDIQVQLSNGLPAFNIVGLADKTVAESKERIRASLTALGLSLPPKRITVNLSPADLQKEGSHFDLPIAIALLTSLSVLPEKVSQEYVALGELSLAGETLPVHGALAAAFFAASEGKKLICPQENAAEAGWGGEQGILGIKSLQQLINYTQGNITLTTQQPKIEKAFDNFPDLQSVKGQKVAKRALEIAAAGGHNLLMIGSPGSGKSLLASCLPGILPNLLPKESLEVSTIHSIAGTLRDGALIQTPPFRAPHHSASTPSLVGGGAKAKPGEISLAHKGVLFLDELPEFQRQTLEALRQPIETGKITISRANAHIDYPANIQLIAAMNPCKCGYADIAEKACTKAPKCATDYQSKISGPLLDRIDLQVHVPPVELDTLRANTSLPEEEESSEMVKNRVHKARIFQINRPQNKQRLNSSLIHEELTSICNLKTDIEEFFFAAAKKMGLSARGVLRSLKVARTIADLEQSTEVTKTHLAEALAYKLN